MKILLIILMIYATSCSFKTPPNQWQFKSSNSFALYTQHFLKGNSNIAKTNLKRAIRHSKNSADLMQLATIYLGECAIKFSIGESIGCKKYKGISTLIKSKELDIYYNLLYSSIQAEDIIFLPKVYQAFALALIEKSYKQATIEMLKQDKITSKLISARVIKDKIDNQTKKIIIKEVSFYGYKKALIFWMKELRNTTKNIEQKSIISQKISILKSN